MSKYQVTFIDKVEGRDTITHGGVSFPIGEAVTIDSDDVEMSPWFIGNRSFNVEEVSGETAKNQDQHDDASENRSDSGGSEDAREVDQKPAVEVIPAAKRARKKVASK